MESRINVSLRLDKNKHRLLKTNADSKNTTLANYISQLIDLGLRLEQANEESKQGDTLQQQLDQINDRLQKVMKLGVESIYYHRHLAMQIGSSTPSDMSNWQAQMSERAKKAIETKAG